MWIAFTRKKESNVPWESTSVALCSPGAITAVATGAISPVGREHRRQHAMHRHQSPMLLGAATGSRRITRRSKSDSIQLGQRQGRAGQGPVMEWTTIQFFASAPVNHPVDHVSVRDRVRCAGGQLCLLECDVARPSGTRCSSILVLEVILLRITSQRIQLQSTD